MQTKSRSADHSEQHTNQVEIDWTPRSTYRSKRGRPNVQSTYTPRETDWTFRSSCNPGQGWPNFQIHRQTSRDRLNTQVKKQIDLRSSSSYSFNDPREKNSNRGRRLLLSVFSQDGQRTPWWRRMLVDSAEKFDSFNQLTNQPNILELKHSQETRRCSCQKHYSSQPRGLLIIGPSDIPSTYVVAAGNSHRWYRWGSRLQGLAV
jgi:hypothetical protein